MPKTDVVLAPDPRFAVVDRMTGSEFEEALVELFEALGFETVERTSVYDKGADLIVVMDGERIAVQAKRAAKAVGIDAVRQLVDGRKAYECDRGLVVTNSYFTEQAQESAARWNVDLWDRRVLADYLEGPEPDIDVSRCAECRSRVTAGITTFCLDNPHRFGGNVYCRKHQSRARRSGEAA